MHTQPHIPVMLEEVVDALSPNVGEVVVDGTFGAGGYSRALLASKTCRVVAIDRDPRAAEFAKKLQEEYPDRLTFIVGNFADMCELLSAHGISQVDGIVLDIGVSSMQLAWSSK